MTDTTALPAPLVPSDVDLRDFGFMPLDVRTLLSSSLWIKAKKDPRVAHAAVSLWCECWHQVPAASLPDDDDVLAELARCDDREWKRIRERALLHFVKCSDGRLYHRHVAEKALEAWEQRGGFRDARENKQSRQQRWRERLKEMSQQLRERGITPPPGASLETLTRLLAASTAPSTSASTVDVRETGKTGTGRETETTPPYPPPGETLGRDVSDPMATDRQPAPRDPDRREPATVPQQPAETPGTAGAICAALRRAGVQRTNPGHPTLVALVQAGATVEELVALVPQTAGKAEPFAYLLAAAVGQRQRAAETAKTIPGPASAPPDPLAWRRDSRSVLAMAGVVGVTARDGEGWAGFVERVTGAWNVKGRPALPAQANPQPQPQEAA